MYRDNDKRQEHDFKPYVNHYDHATTTTNHTTKKIGVLLTPHVHSVQNSTCFGLNQLLCAWRCAQPSPLGGQSSVLPSALTSRFCVPVRMFGSANWQAWAYVLVRQPAPAAISLRYWCRNAKQVTHSSRKTAQTLVNLPCLANLRNQSLTFSFLRKKQIVKLTLRLATF